MQIPASTYRIQLHGHFNLDDLSRIIDYLYELGITTVYASPISTAFKGSQHGYDVTDPLHLNPEIGTEEQLQAIAGRLKNYGMSWLQDIVPNHMAYATDNPWLYDVLERGKGSGYYRFFDIDAHPAGLPGDRLMAPFLGGSLAECLQKGELTLQFTHRGFVIRYFDDDYPVAAASYYWICTVTEGCHGGLLSALDKLSTAAEGSPGEWTAAKNQWLAEVHKDSRLLSYIGWCRDFFNERPGLLETLLEAQPYLLTLHRLSSSLINYRRFFTVNSLICLRMEDPQVFSTWHRRIHHWYASGWIQGLRIDHIDGLAAPKTYIDRLRQLFGRDCFMIAEKILARDEPMPEDWDLQGMTGYEFLPLAAQVLTNKTGSAALLDFYLREVIGLPGYADLVIDRKYDFLLKYMGGELDNLVNLLTGLPLLGAAAQAVPGLKEALGVLMACFPVYRIYPAEKPLEPAERQVVAAAFSTALRRQPECGAGLAFLQRLFLEPGADDPEEKKRQRLVFLMRLMQFTGPLAAKGIEDTSFYVYNPYIAHNEVGDSPAVSGITAEEFHRRMTERNARLPHSLSCTTTHDTKRGEDSRIRLNLLSADPQGWITAVREWRRMNRALIGDAGGRAAPSPNDEYLIYQALLGAWPEDGIVTDVFRERFAGYLQKALREAKTETNYDEPDEQYEQQCRLFVQALLAAGSDFGASFGAFAAAVIRESYAFGLAQLLVKLTAPGIPDIYQGAECWETSLVDPDNRRPVDFERRMTMLRQIRSKEDAGHAAVLGLVLDHPEKGTMKMFVVYRTLNYRRLHPALFSHGEYLPIAVAGPVLVYIRHAGGEWILVLVPLIGGEAKAMGAGKGEGTFRIELPKGAPQMWTELFTGDVHHAPGAVLQWPGWSRFPVAMLTADEDY